MLLLRALRHRNYRLFFYGQSLSLIGTWMQRIAVGWLVYRLTDSAFMLGLVGFLGDLPIVIVAPMAGVLADRWDRRRMLMAVNAVAMIQAFLLAILVLTGTVAIWHVIALTTLLGAAQAFDVPIRQSLLVDMIGKRDDLGNAIALNSSMVHGARLVGPSLAGLLIATAGEGICFVLNALSYVAVIAALIALSTPPGPRSDTASVLAELKGGLAYVRRSAIIRSVLLVLGVVSLVGMPYQVLMPVYAKDLLGGGPRVFGFLVGCSGLGALVGAVYLGSRRTVAGLERVIAVASALFGAGLILLSASRLLWWSLLLMVVTGFGAMVQMASSNTVIQTVADDDKRGRVMGFYTIAYRGMVPIGSLAAGTLAAMFGTSATLVVCGVGCLLAAAAFRRFLARETSAPHSAACPPRSVPDSSD